MAKQVFISNSFTQRIILTHHSTFLNTHVSNFKPPSFPSGHFYLPYLHEQLSDQCLHIFITNFNLFKFKTNTQTVFKKKIFICLSLSLTAQEWQKIRTQASPLPTTEWISHPVLCVTCQAPNIITGNQQNLEMWNRTLTLSVDRERKNPGEGRILAKEGNQKACKRSQGSMAVVLSEVMRGAGKAALPSPAGDCPAGKVKHIET